MPPTIDWPEILTRLALATFAGLVLGLFRSERGMTAGLRTNILVCLTAAVSMIQVNLLLETRGKAPNSFVVMDLMRLPLGILTGMGFIGAGAIIRQGSKISGVTTAATLWLGTTLGLCFGGGQHGLGLAGLGIGFVVLWALKRLEDKLKQERRGTLLLSVQEGGPSDDEIRQLLETAGIRITCWNAMYTRRQSVLRRRIECIVRWPSRPEDPGVPSFVLELVERSGVSTVKWEG